MENVEKSIQEQQNSAQTSRSHSGADEHILKDLEKSFEMTNALHSIQTVEESGSLRFDSAQVGQILMATEGTENHSSFLES